MSDFTLYYWPIPFRGEFPRALLAYGGVTVDEPDADAVAAMIETDPRDQPVAHMAPPILVDNASGKAIAQTPAMCLWLAERFDLVPQDPHSRALALKVMSDINDVLNEMTLDGGREMWTPDAWDDYLPRLRRWMGIWEATVQRDPVPEDQFGLTHVATATFWGAMTERLPQLRDLLDVEAPDVARLTDRARSQGALAAQAEDSRARFGNVWCGGEIEKSLRRVLEN